MKFGESTAQLTLETTSDIESQVCFLVSEAQKHPYGDRTAEFASLTQQHEPFFHLSTTKKNRLSLFSISLRDLEEPKSSKFLQLSWDQNIISCFSLHLNGLQHFRAPQSAAG